MNLCVYWGNGARHCLVGTLSKHQGVLSFSYHADYVALPQAIPVSLSLPLSETAYRGEVVLNWLSNLLPDDANVRERVKRSLHLPSSDVFSVLAEIGRDCIGAWQFLPEGDSFPEPIAPRPLDEQALYDLLQGLPQQPLGMTDAGTFRLSLSGTQEKTGLIQSKQGQWLLPQGDSASTHIIKPSMGVVGQYDMRDSVMNEHICLHLCKAMGYAAADSQPIMVKGLSALAVKRFDRITNENNIIRRPQEDMCQVFAKPPSQKYQSDGGVGIYDITQKLKASAEATLFFEQQVFFWLIGAIDNHGKNTSIFLLPQGRFQLTPCYDVISVAPMVTSGDLHIKKVKMAMAFAGKYEVSWINRERIMREAKACGLPQSVITKQLNNLPERCLSALDEMEKSFPESAETVGAIREYVRLRVLQL